MGYLLLVLALLGAAGLGICHKIADIAKCRPSPINVLLFMTATLVLSVYTFWRTTVHEDSLFPPFHLGAVGVAVVCGTFASLGILSFQIGVRYGRITTSWLIVNLSTLLPAGLSLIIYQEWKDQVKWQHPVAFILVILSVLLLWRDKQIEIESSAPQTGFPVVVPAEAAEKSLAVEGD